MNGERRTHSQAAYSASAAVYNALVGYYAFDHWRENLERLERRYHLDTSCVVDAACGTGLAAMYLAGRGAEVFASDLSPHMLKEAAGACKGGRVRFQRQDMRYLYPPRRVTMLNCATDAMNHLMREADIRRALSSFHAALIPGGYAVFDMNTSWQLREGGDNAPWDFQACGRRMRWLSCWDEGRGISTLTLVFRDGRGDGEDIVETHRERAYDTGWVVEELARSGFSHTDVLDAAGLGKVSDRTRRLLFVARA